MKEIVSYDKSGPFGDADASRVNFQRLRSSFINISEEYNLDSSLDTSIRIIVGRKGSGKTLLIRSIQDSYKRLNDTNKGDNVYVTEIDNEPPNSNLIVKITSWYNQNDTINVDEIWRSIWKFTILRTLYTHIFFSKELKKYLFFFNKDHFNKKYKLILPESTQPSTIFKQLSTFLSKFNSRKDLESHCNLEIWGDFESEITAIINRIPPVYFFLDQIDDDFNHAPYQWLKCQYGLFNCIFRFIRQNLLGGRLHIIACVREIIYAYILHTSDGSKYLSESKIKVLRWDSNLAKHFLIRKVELLEDKYFITNTHNKDLANYFGSENIHTKRNGGIIENIHQYILRHTMLMPRDIINIGNIYWEKKSIYSPEQCALALKDAVRYVAKQIAKEQMTFASILIINNWIYNGIVEDGSIEAFTDDAMITSVNKNLSNLIKKIDKDRFTKKTIMNLNNKLNEFHFNTKDNPFNALYLSGLLGYQETDKDGKIMELFFSESRTAPYILPLIYNRYMFHSSLIDHLGIKAIGDPVYA